MIGDDRFLGPVDILLGTRIKKNLIVTLCFGLIDCWWDKSHACLNKKQQLSKNSTITQATFILLGSRNSGGVSSKISLSQPFLRGSYPTNPRLPPWPPSNRWSVPMPRRWHRWGWCPGVFRGWGLRPPRRSHRPGF